MVAMEGLLLVHIPVNESLRLVVCPIQAEPAPSIGGGVMFTVIGLVLLQPVEDSVNVIVAVPSPMPVTTPDAEPTLATPVAPPDQAPLPDPSVSVMVLPVQTDELPDGAAGDALMVTTFVAAAPHEGV